MAVAIASSVLACVVGEAAAAPDREVCGLLLGEPDAVTMHLPACNVADDPRRFFEVDPAALVAAHRAERAGGPKVVGHYHSHPDGAPEPSTADAAAAAWDDALWLIVAGGTARLFRASRARRFVALDFALPAAGPIAKEPGPATSRGAPAR